MVLEAETAAVEGKNRQAGSRDVRPDVGGAQTVNINPVIAVSKINRMHLLVVPLAYLGATVSLLNYFRPDGDFFSFFLFGLNVFSFALNAKKWESNRKWIKEFREEFLAYRRFRIFLAVSIKMWCPGVRLAQYQCIRFEPKKESE